MLTATTLPWSHRFADLGPAFHTPLPPTPLPAPYRVGVSRALARELGLDDEWLASDDALQMMAGNRVPPGARPLASVYSGHQFGVWAGQLGDGRALLLGELPRRCPSRRLVGAARRPQRRRPCRCCC